MDSDDFNFQIIEMKYEAGTGPEGENWKGTAEVDWKVLRLQEPYMPMNAHPGFLGNNELPIYLHFNSLVKNPWQKVISSGIRHLATSQGFLNSCPVWADIKDGIMTEKQLVAPSAINFIVNNANTNGYQLEHYFECRFAGPLVAACFEARTINPELANILVLLNRIVNHELNLAWVPNDLNALKSKYFAGGDININDIPPLADYMDNMALRFRTLISIIAFAIDHHVNEVNHPLYQMLKALYTSPFCNGWWRNYMLKETLSDESAPESALEFVKWTMVVD